MRNSKLRGNHKLAGVTNVAPFLGAAFFGDCDGCQTFRKITGNLQLGLDGPFPGLV
jgi:hypothetical protein